MHRHVLELAARAEHLLGESPERITLADVEELLIDVSAQVLHLEADRARAERTLRRMAAELLNEPAAAGAVSDLSHGVQDIADALEQLESLRRTLRFRRESLTQRRV